METGDEAAVKEINLSKLNAKLRQSLESEVSILKRINHGNIVKLHEVLEVRRWVAGAGGHAAPCARRLPPKTRRGKGQHLLKLRAAARPGYHARAAGQRAALSLAPFEVLPPRPLPLP